MGQDSVAVRFWTSTTNKIRTKPTNEMIVTQLTANISETHPTNYHKSKLIIPNTVAVCQGAHQVIERQLRPPLPIAPPPLPPPPSTDRPLHSPARTRTQLHTARGHGHADTASRRQPGKSYLLIEQHGPDAVHGPHRHAGADLGALGGGSRRQAYTSRLCRYGSGERGAGSKWQPGAILAIHQYTMARGS